MRIRHFHQTRLPRKRRTAAQRAVLAELRAAMLDVVRPGQAPRLSGDRVREGLRYIGVTRQPVRCAQCARRFEVDQQPGTPETVTRCPTCGGVLE